MARPAKQTVDYFPHQCNHGKTMFILEQKYGNDGYAFWFKLLEMLGGHEGHFIKLNDPVDQEFLEAKTRIEKEKCFEILDLLSNIGAIDKPLWEEKKIVWSDNFVTNISDVYKNRRVKIPPKPSFYRQKPSSAGVSTGENPQTKLKETKVKETKENNDMSTSSKSTADDYRSVYDHYLTKDNLTDHRVYTKAMAESIKRAMKDLKITVEDCKLIIDRHSRIVEMTEDSKYPVRKQNLDKLFGSTVYNGKTLKCAEYLDDGDKYNRYLKNGGVNGRSKEPHEELADIPEIDPREFA